MIPIVLTIICLILILYAVVTTTRIQHHLDKMPGPLGHPIIGNIIEFLVEPDILWEKIRSMGNQYYPIYKIWTTQYTAVNIRHPQDVEVLLTSQKNISKGLIYTFLENWFGTGLLTSTGHKWRNRRKILTPAFHFNVLRGFADIFDKEGHRMVQDLKSQNDSVTVDLVSFITKYTLNAICETAMGTSLSSMESSQDNFLNVYRQSIHDLGKTIIYRILRLWFYFDLIFSFTFMGRLQKQCLKIVRSFSKKIIDERQKYHEGTKEINLGNINEINNDLDTIHLQSSTNKLAMLDLLIAAKKNGDIDDNGIWEEVDTFIFEGHDTTAMSISFTLLLLAEHKDIQQRIRLEIDEVLKNCGDHMKITELQQLSYLERCIKEALRLYPSVPTISRQITDDMQLKNYMIPAGTVVHIHIFDVHRDPNFWPDPLRYDPDRFLPERIQGRHPFSYVPFSGGPRNCIGQKFAMLELKAMISHLIHNFYLEPIDLASNVRISADLVLRPKTSTKIKFIPR